MREEEGWSMSRIYCLEFSVAADALLGLLFGESVRAETSYVTAVGGLGLRWRLRLYPHGLQFNDKTRTNSFHCTAELLDKAMGKGLSSSVQLQLKDQDGRFPVINDCFSTYAKWDVGPVALSAAAAPELVPGGRVAGRWILLLDPATVSPSIFASARLVTVPVHDASRITSKLLDAGLAGDSALCDTLLVCADGVVRAASSVLCVDNAYFRALYGYKEKAVKADLKLDFLPYSVAVVSALLRLMHNVAPSLEGWELAKVMSLLSLVAQVIPDRGLELLKATAEKTLMDRKAAAKKELGDLGVLLSARLGAVSVRDAGRIISKLLLAGLAGETALCDTLLVCADGDVRAASCILRVDNPYFRALYDFKYKAGQFDVKLDFAAYSVAVVSALLRLMHSVALPSLAGWELTKVTSLLDLVAQVNPVGGLQLLKATVEKSLLSRVSEEEELGELSVIADLYELPILANVAALRLASAPIHYYRKFRGLGDDIDWTSVDAMSKNSDNGQEYASHISLKH